MKEQILVMMLAAALSCGMTGAAHAATDTQNNVPFAGKESVQLSRGGKASVAITVLPQASEEVRKTAAELAGFLARITGTEFAVTEGNSSVAPNS
jgi:hypothetical protein